MYVKKYISKAEKFCGGFQILCEYKGFSDNAGFTVTTD